MSPGEVPGRQGVRESGCEPLAAGSCHLPAQLSPLRAALDAFPPVAHAFAYGSAVFAQPGAEALRVPGEEGPQVDLIFAVDDPVEWHRENLERNAGHYSWVASHVAGPHGLVAVSHAVGAGVHFNPFVRLGSQTVKYGVIDTARLVRDLWTWETLYVAGRMHKPVATLAADDRVATAADANLRSALAAALLLLPSRFSEAQLHNTLCGLSYTGDVRMAIAEDASKVQRIATGSAGPLRQMYRGAIARASAWRAALAPSAAAVASTGGTEGPVFVQNKDPIARRELLAALPPGVLHRMAHVLRGTGPLAPLSLPTVPHIPATSALSAGSSSAMTSALVDVVAQAPQPQALLRRALAATVRASSGRQALAGLLTAGLGTAVRYVGRKVTKAWRSRTVAPGAHSPLL